MTIATLLRWTAFLAPVLGLISPLALAPLLAVATVGAVGLHVRRHRSLPPLSPVPAGLVVALVLWGAISLFWTPSPGYGLFAVGRVSFILLGGLALAGLVADLPASERRRVAAGLFAGLVPAAMIFGANIFFDGAATEFLRRFADLPAYHPNQMKRPATVLAILLWPALLALPRRQRVVALTAAMAVGLILAVKSPSATAAVAVAAAALTFAAHAFYARRPAVIRAVASAIALAVLAGPLFSLAPALTHGQAIETYLPSSFLHRLYIWSFAAHAIERKPVFGWGLEGARAIPGGADLKPIPVNAANPDGAGSEIQIQQQPSLPLHPHNAGLQIWLELGLPGIALALALIVYTALKIGRMNVPPRIAGLCIAQLVCTFLIAQSSYGIWQGWWLSGIVLGAVFMTAFIPPSGPQPDAPTIRR